MLLVSFKILEAISKSLNFTKFLLCRKNFRRFANFEFSCTMRFAVKDSFSICDSLTLSSKNIWKSKEMSTSLFFSENNILEREIDAENKATKLSLIWNANELNRCIKFLREGSFAKVCLQFSDEIINYSVEIEKQLKKHIDSNVFLLADTSYGSCCVDEVRFNLY